MTMNYAIIDNDAITAHGRTRDLWPGTSFPPTGPNEAFLAEESAVPIRSDLPHDPETEYLQRVEPYLLNGEAWNRQAVTRPTPPPVPQWVAFGGALAADPSINTLVTTAASAAPVLHLMLGVGLGQAAQGDSQTFLAAWGQAVAGGLATPELVAAIQAMATTYDLPAEFIAALAPAGGE